MKRNWFLEWCSVSRIMLLSLWDFLRGLRMLNRMPQPIISVLGGKSAYEDGEYACQAYEFARLCAMHDISVITGGGAGIMQAANCGAENYDSQKKSKKKHTLGIGVKWIDKDYANPCAYVLQTQDLFIRKKLLINFSAGLVIFPGGIGTASELFSALDFIKLGTLERIPVILINKTYWASLIEWYHHAIAKGLIPEECAEYLVITDDIQEAFRLIHPACKH